VKFDFNRKVLR